MSVQRLVALLMLSLVPLSANAQQTEKKPKVPTIMAARVGLPGPENTRRPRLGAWVPVYVDIYSGKDDIDAEALELQGEWSDGDARSQYLVPVPAIPKEQSRIALTYYRPADREGALSLTLRRKGGATLHQYKVEAGIAQLLDPSEVLVLSLGSPMTGLRKALLPQTREGDEAEDSGSQTDRAVAVITNVEQMPRNWFGYQAVDVVVLSTGSDAFLDELGRNSNAAALTALRDWLRRGGSLVLSAGRNSHLVGDLLPKLGINGFVFEKKEQVTELPELGQWVGGQPPPFPGTGGIEVVRGSLKNGAIPLAEERKGEKCWPVLALAPTGLGRVLLVAFDLDAAAFTSWSGQTSFWQKLYNEMSPRQLARGRGAGDPSGRTAEVGAVLQRGLESFEEVPVISFGWVAFFILIYILIVGPLDYWFLKKVVKRLELTWITFPLVVLVVSVAAYITAYKLKGNHLRINKIDVVDINLRDGEVQGTTWFSVFSPRVQAYTVGIEPSLDWVGGSTEEGEPFVSTLNALDGSIGGMDRPTSSSFFRRPFQYETDARGLRGVPVPVWASRSFTASWRLKVEGKPLVELKNFGPSRDGTRLIGSIHSNLPVELTEVTLLVRGTPYNLDNLPAKGAGYNIGDRNILFQGSRNLANWFDEPFRPVARGSTGRRRTLEDPNVPGKLPDERIEGEEYRAGRLMKDVLFHAHEANRGSSRNNGGLRPLDQSWRLKGTAAVLNVGERRYLDEAILIGRVAVAPGTAEKVVETDVSPTRLWLGRLPGEGEREPLPGFLGQDTYVRIYIPIPSE